MIPELFTLPIGFSISASSSLLPKNKKTGTKKLSEFRYMEDK
jgi:hypothetical protein